MTPRLANEYLFYLHDKSCYCIYDNNKLIGIINSPKRNFITMPKENIKFGLMVRHYDDVRNTIFEKKIDFQEFNY